MRALDLAQEIVTGSLPTPVAYWSQPIPDSSPTDDVVAAPDANGAGSSELAQLREEVATLRTELYGRVSGDLFHYSQENISHQIKSIWEYLEKSGSDIEGFFPFCTALARQVATHDIASAPGRFCEALLVAIGLDDRSAWSGVYWHDSHTAPLLDAGLGKFLNVIMRSGLIRLPEQAEVVDDAGFIAICYAIILGRRPDSDGMETYTKRLMDNLSREDLVQSLATSEEAKLYAQNCRQKRVFNSGAPLASNTIWKDLYFLLQILAFS